MITPLLSLLDTCFDAQTAATALWHCEEPNTPDVDTSAPATPETLLALVRAQHLRNFKLWHVEDIARRRDVTPDIIADCKYRIDRLNQERNDRMERVDACLVALLAPLLPTNPAKRINTESLGMGIDRLSILSLKIWHMDEQIRRDDVTAEHISSCTTKLAVLKEQREDLCHAVKDLVAEFVAGTKTPKLYFQFKMYNDPALNPQLYQK